MTSPDIFEIIGYNLIEKHHMNEDFAFQFRCVSLFASKGSWSLLGALGCLLAASLASWLIGAPKMFFGTWRSDNVWGTLSKECDVKHVLVERMACIGGFRFS